MIPLTPDGREGLRRIVAMLDAIPAGHRARADAEAIKGRDPAMTAAMAWIDSLPPGPILLWQVGGGTLRCEACPCHVATNGACTAKRIFGLEQCPIEGGGVLVAGAP